MSKFEQSLTEAIENAGNYLIEQLSQKDNPDEWRKNLDALIKLKKAIHNDSPTAEEEENIDDLTNALISQIEETEKKISPLLNRKTIPKT